MDAYALPSELLDEQELHERYRLIDKAASDVRIDIERQIKREGRTVVPGRFNVERLKTARA